MRRFGALVTTRLDQAFGRVAEAIEPVFPPELIQARLTFIEPLLTAEAFATVIDRLTAAVCADLERSGGGARRLDLLFERVDGTTQAIRIGTARASRDARHLARLLKERIERIDPGLGVEAMRLVVPRVDALTPMQTAARLTRPDVEEPDIAPLIDRLATGWGWSRCTGSRRWTVTCRNVPCVGCAPSQRRSGSVAGGFAAAGAAAGSAAAGGGDGAAAGSPADGVHLAAGAPPGAPRRRAGTHRRGVVETRRRNPLGARLLPGRR